MYKTLIFIYILTVSCTIHAARILAVFPTPSLSHQVVFRVLTQELAKCGHEVVVITPDPAFPISNAPANLTEIDVHDVSYRYLQELMSNEDTKLNIGEGSNVLPLLKATYLLYKVLEVQLRCKPVQDLISEKNNFDVILIEAYIRPAIIFSHIFKAPVIQISSFGPLLENLEVIGASTHPMLYPNPFRQRFYNLSIWEKLLQYYTHLQFIYYDKLNALLIDNMLKSLLGLNIPSIHELNNNIDMLFLNVHPIWMDNQPMPPNVVFMGGLHQNPMRELTQDLKSYLDSSKNGVVYVSFGTNVHPFMFSAERLRTLTETLSELPYDVLFKWNDEELPGRTTNIKIAKWLPQSDILRHPKVKAFLTQGGLQSTDEAITAGVPLVCIPMLADQWYNAEKYERFKIGLKLDLFMFTKADLKHAIESVITNNSYRENIVKLRERMNDQPQSPLERAVWWVEYVVRHGGAKHLRSPAANMSWADYLELELVLVVVTGFLILLAVSLYISVLLWRLIARFLYIKSRDHLD